MTPNERLKAFVRRRFPELYDAASRWIGHPARYQRVARLVVSRYGQKVVEGPFAGMKYIATSAGSAYIPKILGCYEMEIRSIIDEIIVTDYEVIVDVGCAEGYYAVGFARSCPHASVYAFDVDPMARGQCRKLAGLNGVADRVHIGGVCQPQAIAELTMKRALLFCDIEGNELELLDPAVIPALSSIDILVELHEPLRAGVTATIADRFRTTHAIKLIDALERDPEQHPLVRFLGSKDRRLALAESRPPGQQFGFLQCRS